MAEIFSSAGLFALVQVLMINLVLSGDNAVVIGMVAARVAASQRRSVILWGMAAAVGLRLILAAFAVKLLNVLGLTLAGGIILLWVAWRLYRDIREQKQEEMGLKIVSGQETSSPAPAAAVVVPLRRAIFQIALADISMSVDNVLAVAGAANEHVTVLVIGLVVSIALMGVAASYIAKLLQRFSWLAYVGVALIVYVATEMIWEGKDDLPELMRLFSALPPRLYLE